MVNVSSSPSVYFQTTNWDNLPRLLNSLAHAGISHTVLRNVYHLPTPAGSAAETVEIMLSPTGYAKFQQVFVGQRCICVQDAGEYTFWDSRTGLTFHILIGKVHTPSKSVSHFREAEPIAIPQTPLAAPA